MADDDDDDLPQLSETTLLALQEFLREQACQDDENIKENWQLSQFWYDDETIQCLSRAALSLCENNSKIALISCPSLYKKITELQNEVAFNIEVKLFEFDKRFSCFKSDFIFYDYNEPLNVNEKYKNYFDIILVDPPFLSNECLSKTAKTVQYISKINSKIIFCTGSIMESLAKELLNIKKCSFCPMHKNNLANDFICMTNFGELQS